MLRLFFYLNNFKYICNMQNKRPYNKKGQRHGYWELYWDNGQLARKCYYINGVRYGYDEFYWFDGDVKHKRYYAR